MDLTSYQLFGDLPTNSDISVILPTYSEAENIEMLIDQIESLPFSISILVIDDSSPDETGAIVKNLQRKYQNILLCSRPRKSGLGTAIADGFRILLSSKSPPRLIVTMDADYSHNPKNLPKLLPLIENRCGIVIGSRYCRGGEINGWTWKRRIISRIANILVKKLFNLKPYDCTSGFRCYSVEFLKLATDNLNSKTYEIQIETLRKAINWNFAIREIPISFTGRKSGKSKMNLPELQNYFSFILKNIVQEKSRKLKVYAPKMAFR